MVRRSFNSLQAVPSQPDPHANIIIPIVTVTVIDSRDRILLLQREKPGEIFEGYWEVVGGRIEFGERSVDAAQRELQEEAGIVARPEFVTVLEHVGRYSRFVDSSYHRLMFVYVVTVGETRVSKTEHRHYRWFPLDGVPGKVIPFNREAIFRSLAHIQIYPPGQLPLFAERAFERRLTLVKSCQEDEEMVESPEIQHELFPFSCS